jgi:uncharacterized protein with HEPN domain
MPDKVPGWLVEIEDAIKRIRTYTNGLNKSQFLATPITCDATALQLIIIGEAARRLPHDVRNEAPEIPWAQIVSLRHRIVHDYKTIDHAVVWEIVEQRLDDLEAAVRRMLAARGE